MTLMLVAMFGAVGLGLISRGFGRREAILCLFIAASLTLAYFLRPSLIT